MKKVTHDIMDKGIGAVIPPRQYPNTPAREALSDPKKAVLYQNWGNLGTSKVVRVITIDPNTGEEKATMRDARGFNAKPRKRKSAPKAKVLKVPETAMYQSKYRHDFNS